jgi:hypothetical protein
MPDTNMMSPQLIQGARFAPARVNAVLREEVEVAFDDRLLFARLAVPAVYRPVAGDEVLVIEAADAAFVVGVLRANGPTEICAPGDLRLLAPNGHIQLEAPVVHTTTAEVRIDAGLMTIAAGEVREALGAVFRRVRGMVDSEAVSIVTRVRDLFSLSAGRLRASASGDVKIDGEHIHLG